MKKKSHPYCVRLPVLLYVMENYFFAASARASQTLPKSSAVKKPSFSLFLRYGPLLWRWGR